MQYSATNKNGMIAKWIARGATLTELHVPDRSGQLADVVLGFDDVAGYESEANQHFGCTTGRYANRICGGRFSLDGTDYQLAMNNGPNHLHGGPQRALDKVTWDATPLDNGIRFTYSSPAGEENFPGRLDVAVTYTLIEYDGIEYDGMEHDNSDNVLRIDYLATTDQPTIINLTNHSYFNLSGHGAGSVLDHEVWIDADRYTPVDETSIPTGELADVAGTPFDFRTRQPLGVRIDQTGSGYDHNFVLNHGAGKRSFKRIAELFDPQSGRMMSVSTCEPGVQLYTGNGLSGQTGKLNQTYAQHSAVCFETQHFPDSPNQPHFPTTVLRPGETYRHTCAYAFGTRQST